MDFVNLISSVGFPIVAYLMMYAQVEKLTEQHTREINDLKKCIDNNTIVITKLYERSTINNE